MRCRFHAGCPVGHVWRVFLPLTHFALCCALLIFATSIVMQDTTQASKEQPTQKEIRCRRLVAETANPSSRYATSRW